MAKKKLLRKLMEPKNLVDLILAFAMAVVAYELVVIGLLGHTESYRDDLLYPILGVLVFSFAAKRVVHVLDRIIPPIDPRQLRTIT